MNIRLRRSSLLALLSSAALAACSTPSMNNPDVVADSTPADTTPPVDSGVMEMDGSTPADSGVEDDASPDSSTPPADASGAPDWSFRPMPNGFAFENYTNADMPVNLTPIEMRRIFGPAVCEGASAMGACNLTPQARQWMERQNAGMNGGHCEGMAVLAARMFSGASDPMMFGGGATAGALMLPGNEALTREIATWFVTQSTLPTLERRNLTPVQVVADLERELARGRAYGGTVVGIYLRAGGGGHAITPYLVRRPDANTAEIVTYDNNFPNVERVVTVNTMTNTWRYMTSTNPMEPGAVYDGDATTFNLTLADVAPRAMFPHPCQFCGDAPMDGGGTRGVQISMRGEGDVAIRDGMGNTTGTNATGGVVNAIPGAGVTLQRSGTLYQDSPEPLYTVPRMTPLTITLDGSRITRMSPSDLLVTGPGFALGVEDINLDPMQRDTITIQPGAPDITYRASGTETPTLVLAFEHPGADYLIELRSTAMTAGQVLRLSVDFAMQRARISFDGSTSAPGFTLYMDRVSDTGAVNFSHAGVTATSSTVLFVNFGSWGGNGMPLSLGVDTNGDGTVDRTDMLTDES
jgi:hypothetical protein